MILRNYSKIIKKTNKEKKMIRKHNYKCKGLVKMRTKTDDDVQFVWTEVTYSNTTFADAFGRFDRLLESNLAAASDHYDIKEPQVENCACEITMIEKDYS